jgi:PadR family transcriptional regulator AphA
MADRPLPATTYAVLGLLSIAPRSGYDLYGFAEGTIAHFWTLNKSQTYAELARLEELGYAKATEVRQDSLPDKRVYRITPSGRRALKEWLDSPIIEPDRFRSSFLVKVFFADHMDRENLARMLDDYRIRAEKVADYLEETNRRLSDLPDYRYMRATARLGSRINRAASEWASETIRELTRGRKRR